MRSTPLAVWGHALSPDAVAAHARADARLSHPNRVTQDINACYVVAAAALIRRPGDAAGALQTVEAWAAAQHNGLAPEVRQWLMEDSHKGATDASEQIGWAKVSRERDGWARTAEPEADL